MVITLLITLCLLHSNRYFIAIGVDQLINTILWGYPDETISARIWREQHSKRRWAIALKLVNALFFWQANHCRGAYYSEITRKHIARVYR